MSDTDNQIAEPDDYWHGWNAAYDDEGWDECASADWQRGYSEARLRQSDDDAELANG